MPELAALQVQTPNALNSLGSLVNIASGAQNIQRQGVALKQEQMDLQERSALRNLAANIKDYTKDDGSPDYEKLAPAAMTAAPKLGMAWLQQVGAAHAQTAAANKSWLDLNEDQRAAVNKVVLSTADQPFPVIQGALTSIAQGNPQLKPWVDLTLGRLAADKDNPDALKNTAYRIAESHGGIGEQIGAQTGAYTSVGPALVNVSPAARATGGNPPNLALGITPSERQTVSINPVTQSPMTTIKDAAGNVVGVQQTPTGGGIPNLAPGEPQEIPTRTAERIAVNAAAAKVPEQHFNNQQIIKLANVGLTGTGADTWSKVAGSMGLQWVPGDHAANFQKMQHFMALQAQNNASAMGAGTDAARAMSEAATNKTNWTREAVVATAKINDALASGVSAFNEGMEKAISAAGGNVLAKRDFQNAWSQVFDVRAMQLHNALENGDKAEVKRIVNDVGGPRSQGARALANKVTSLNKLIATGHL